MSRVGVYVSGAIGDAVLHAPLIKGLAEYLGTPVVLIDDLRDETNLLFAEQAWVSRAVSARHILHAPRGTRTRAFRALLQELALDEIYFFNFRTYAALAAWLAGVRKRVAFVHWNGFPRILMFTHWAIVHRWTQTPRSLAWMTRVFERNGMRVLPQYPAIGGGAPATPRARPLVALGVNASSQMKQYGAPGFVRLVRELEAALPNAVDYLLFGAPDVAEVAAQVKRDARIRGEFVDITSTPTPITDSARWMAQCAAYVGNDSFGMHLAVVQKVPSVGLFWHPQGMAYAPWLKPVEPRYPSLYCAGLDPQDVAFHAITTLRAWAPQLFEVAP
jgi:ADP-heptose:LPS heptosyltransferase